MTQNELLLNEQEAAALLTVKPATLAGWRCEGKGPAFCKMEGAIRYLRTDLTAWIENSRISTKSQGENND